MPKIGEEQEMDNSMPVYPNRYYVANDKVIKNSIKQTVLELKRELQLGEHAVLTTCDVKLRGLN